eukprot:scaffold71444_cov29-Tisochrysis_lutea.AAC.2
MRPEPCNARSCGQPAPSLGAQHSTKGRGLCSAFGLSADALVAVHWRKNRLLSTNVASRGHLSTRRHCTAHAHQPQSGAAGRQVGRLKRGLQWNTPEAYRSPSLVRYPARSARSQGEIVGQGATGAAEPQAGRRQTAGVRCKRMSRCQTCRRRSSHGRSAHVNDRA